MNFLETITSQKMRGKLERFDWTLLFAALALSLGGLVTMNSFEGDNRFFDKQLIWVCISLAILIFASFIDFRFLRRTKVIVSIFVFTIGLLLLLFVFGSVFKGSQSWFNLGFFAFQPSDPAKLVLILILAKYFSRRHIEIAHIKHIFISGIYALILFVLVLIQPDFGSAIMLFLIWLGMVLVSGLSKKHLFAVFALGAISFTALWFYGFENYQKQRIMTFIHPLADIHGAGYNAYQSTIAVGSGQIFGKGIGYGTQSKLQFLPEYQTDFIFAAFAEEWGFIGVVLLFAIFGIVIWRLLRNATLGETNFETLFCTGVALLIMIHFVVNIGMNIGLLPVTGVTLPFPSYGGSHLATEFLALGIVMAMRRYSRGIHRDDTTNEFVGI